MIRLLVVIWLLQGFVWIFAWVCGVIVLMVSLLVLMNDCLLCIVLILSTVFVSFAWGWWCFFARCFVV